LYLLDIPSAAVAKTIIDTEICESALDHFVARVWEVHQKIIEKRAPSAFTTEAPAADSPNQDTTIRMMLQKTLMWTMMRSWKYQ
jgi:hypothetical protein